MKFMLLIYNDPELLDAMPAGEFDGKMRDCLMHADELQEQGCLLESQQLEEAATAKSVRIRKGRQTVIDGPFTETEAVRIAAEFPWAHTGCVEVRPVRDIGAVRERVMGASGAEARR